MNQILMKEVAASIPDLKLEALDAQVKHYILCTAESIN
jgi:hypothetical protein